MDNTHALSLTEQPMEGQYMPKGIGHDMEQDDEETRKQRLARIDALGMSLARTRSEDIAARAASGIEDVWAEDEEFYEGVDEMNRGEEKATWRTKPPGQTTTKSTATTRSTVFPNITGPFVDAAAARISDMLLPTDDRSWAIKPTPIPDLAYLAKGKLPTDIGTQIKQVNVGNPEQEAADIEALKAEATKVVEEANEACKNAQKRIEDWHVECQWHAEVRQVIEDAARLGTGILKGPVPIKKKQVIWKNGKMEIITKINPGSKWVDPFNFYPDGACGENIHNGSRTWERDTITRRQLRDLIGVPGYIKEQIMAVLEEGPMNATAVFKETPDPVGSDQSRKNKFEIWYMHGTAEREDIEAAGCNCGDQPDPHIPIIVTMVNNRVIRVSMNPLDTGDFPYDVMVWRRRSGHWTGIGVARQGRVAQKIYTASYRNMMDNAGLAAGVMIVYKQGVVLPSDGIAGIAPRKVFWIAKDDESIQDATKAIGVIKVDMLVDELMKIAQAALQLFESATSMPMILQGQMGQSVPDTLGGQQMFMNNASTVLRRLARLFDDRVTEPHVRRYYAWLLQYGENDEEKGDWTVDARGSSALVEREIQNQELMQMGQLVLDPRFGKDPKKWMDEYLLSRHFDPKKFSYTDQEWQKIVEGMKQPQDPRIQVTQMNNQTKQQIEQFKAQLAQAQRDWESGENSRNRELELMMMNVDAELEQMRQQGQNTQNIENIKAKLADTVMKLRTQVQLSGQDHAAEAALTPPSEPAGRAKAGESYQS